MQFGLFAREVCVSAPPLVFLCMLISRKEIANLLKNILRLTNVDTTNTLNHLQTNSHSRSSDRLSKSAWNNSTKTN